MYIRDIRVGSAIKRTVPVINVPIIMGAKSVIKRTVPIIMLVIKMLKIKMPDVVGIDVVKMVLLYIASLVIWMNMAYYSNVAY